MALVTMVSHPFPSYFRLSLIALSPLPQLASILVPGSAIVVALLWDIKYLHEEDSDDDINQPAAGGEEVDM
eukprot:scaffold281245_cov18-Prasinocladus_malaysianus.AAC.1